MAGAWTLLQVFEYFGETYAWPRAVRQIAGLALPLGLLFVLVLAWYHGDKGDQRVSRPELAILATLVAFVGGTLWWYVPRIDESAWVADTGVLNTRHALPPVRRGLEADAGGACSRRASLKPTPRTVLQGCGGKDCSLRNALNSAAHSARRYCLWIGRERI
jgi:hypothetical protein